MPKQLHFHEDLASVTICINGHPVSLQGEVDVVVKEPTKKSASNKQGWALVDRKNAGTVSVDNVSYSKGEGDA